MMSRLDTLPPELILNVFAYLPVQSLHSIHLVSRHWHNFIAANDSTIYHYAALLHHFIPSINQSIVEATTIHAGKYMEGVDSWKSYCQSSFQLERNWVGQGSAKIKTYPWHAKNVHRIKVDEAVGLLITTHYHGGLSVTDLESGELLWELSWTHVREHAHCEYERGFLIFDRLDGYKEVWRLASDYDDAQTPLKSRPDEDQLAAWDLAEQRYPETGRGHFRPWALLRMPEHTVAFRFVYPTLAVVAPNTAYLWDVRSAELVQTIRGLQVPHGGNTSLGMIRYVEVSATHVFLCGSSEFRVFDRQSGLLVLHMLSEPTSPRKAVVLDLSAATQTTQLAGNIVPIKAIRPVMPIHNTLAYASPFVGAHVSACGRDIAVLLGGDRVVLIRDFEHVTKGDVSLHDASLEVNISTPTDSSYMSGLEKSVYLAFGSGRVGVVTTSGVFIFTLDAVFHGLLIPRSSNQTNLGIINDTSFISTDASFPHLASSYVKGFTSAIDLSRVSCLQMTRTKLFLTWDVRDVPKDDAIDTDATKEHLPPWAISHADSTPESEEVSEADGTALPAAADWFQEHLSALNTVDVDAETMLDGPFGDDGGVTHLMHADFVEDMDDREEEVDEDDGIDYHDGGEFGFDDFGGPWLDEEPHPTVVCCVDFSPRDSRL